MVIKKNKSYTIRDLSHYQAELGIFYNEKGQFQNGKYLDANGSPIILEEVSASIWMSRLEWDILRRHFELSYKENIASAASVVYGKKVLILDYEYEDDDNRNLSIDSLKKKGYIYNLELLNRIFGNTKDEDFLNVFYYKFTFHNSDMMSISDFYDILEKTGAEYIIFIGNDLLYRIPSTFCEGHNIVIEEGFASTLSINDSKYHNITCLPIPHPQTPGFDYQVEKIWHKIFYKMLK